MIVARAVDRAFEMGDEGAQGREATTRPRARAGESLSPSGLLGDPGQEAALEGRRGEELLRSRGRERLAVDLLEDARQVGSLRGLAERAQQGAEALAGLLRRAGALEP